MYQCDQVWPVDPRSMEPDAHLTSLATSQGRRIGKTWTACMAWVWSSSSSVAMPAQHRRRPEQQRTLPAAWQRRTSGSLAPPTPACSAVIPPDGAAPRAPPVDRGHRPLHQGRLARARRPIDLDERWGIMVVMPSPGGPACRSCAAIRAEILA